MDDFTLAQDNHRPMNPSTSVLGWQIIIPVEFDTLSLSTSPAYAITSAIYYERSLILK